MGRTSQYLDEVDKQIKKSIETMNKADEQMKKESEQINELDKKIKKVRRSINKTKKKFNEILPHLYYISNQKDEIIEMVKNISINLLVETTMVIIKNNCDSKYKYTSFQKTTDAIDDDLANHEMKYPNMKIILRINHIYNPIDLSAIILEM